MIFNTFWFHNNIKARFYRILSWLRCFYIFRILRYEFDNYADKMPKMHFEVGELVFDDLTSKLSRVIKISKSKNSSCEGYWLNNNYLGGGRHPWELGKLKKRK